MDTIFVDMDGVLIDFTSGVDKVHGRHLDWSAWSGGLNPDEFWSPINAAGNTFWEELEPYPWAQDLLNMIGKYTHEVYILTSPAREPCASGKLASVAKHFPGMERRTIITSHKHLLARPGRTLIDDSESNCLLFNKAGGSCIVFPQPWNHYSNVTDRIPHVQTILGNLHNARYR